jgi:hypothetical protein
MFGRPEWFREKTIGWGLVPITWQGWGYTTLWVLVLIAPYMAMLSLGRLPEAFIWLAAMIGFLTWDVRLIIRAMRAGREGDRSGKPPAAKNGPPPDILFLDDDPEEEHLLTHRYHVRVR